MEENEVLTPEDVKELAPLYEDVILAIKQVYDPEIPVNVYDLGLIYELQINKAHEVYIKMTFTAPNCPMADEVLADVRYNVENTPGVTKCRPILICRRSGQVRSRSPKRLRTWRPARKWN